MTRKQLERVYLISAKGYGSIGAEDQEAIRAVLYARYSLEKQVNLLEGGARLTQSLTIEPLTAALHTAIKALVSVSAECDLKEVLIQLKPWVDAERKDRP